MLSGPLSGLHLLHFRVLSRSRLGIRIEVPETPLVLANVYFDNNGGLSVASLQVIIEVETKKLNAS